MGEYGMTKERNDAVDRYIQSRKGKVTRQRARTKYIAKVKDIAALNKARWIIAKGGKCSVCGNLYPPAAMHFHHVNPKEKTLPIHKSMFRNMSEELIRELDKCVVICANCHIIEHAVDISNSMEAYEKCLHI